LSCQFKRITRLEADEAGEICVIATPQLGYLIKCGNKSYSLTAINSRAICRPTDAQQQACEICGGDHMSGTQEDLGDTDLCLYCLLMLGRQPFLPSQLFRQCKLYPSLKDDSQRDGSNPKSLSEYLKEIKNEHGY